MSALGTLCKPLGHSRTVPHGSLHLAVKLWDGQKGTFVATFRGHVGPVYQVIVGPGRGVGPA